MIQENLSFREGTKQIIFHECLVSAKKILGMKITQDRSQKLLWLSQESYIEKLFEGFNMHKAKSISTPLAGHFKLCMKQSPISEKEKAEMLNVPYSFVVGSLMYAMICTRLDIG